MAENQVKTSSSELKEPEMKGWLLKWTNYLKGYQRRWFVLSNGVLSYYRYVVYIINCFVYHEFQCCLHIRFLLIISNSTVKVSY